MINQWHDFFLMMGSGAAALTGLVFVAMTLNLGEIVKEITHKKVRNYQVNILNLGHYEHGHTELYILLTIK